MSRWAGGTSKEWRQGASMESGEGGAMARRSAGMGNAHSRKDWAGASLGKRGNG